MAVTPDEIRTAFASATRPPPPDIAPHRGCDECEGIRRFFASQPQCDVPREPLRRMTAALSLFGDAAFVYWLPAFLFAELHNTGGEADDFADPIARAFLPSRNGTGRAPLLSAGQARVVAALLDECGRRYPNPEYNADFSAAAAHVRAQSEAGQAAT